MRIRRSGTVVDVSACLSFCGTFGTRAVGYEPFLPVLRQAIELAW